MARSCARPPAAASPLSLRMYMYDRAEREARDQQRVAVDDEAS